MAVDLHQVLAKIQALERGGRLHEAAYALRAAVGASPDSEYLRWALCDVLRRAGRSAEALAEAEAAAAALPASAAAWGTLALHRRIHDQPDGALAASARAAAVDAGSYGLEVHSLTLWHLGRFEEALSCARAATERAPGEPGPRLRSSWALRALGRFDEAAAAAEEIIALAPARVEGYDLLLQAALAAGDAGGARAAERRMLAACPDLAALEKAAWARLLLADAPAVDALRDRLAAAARAAAARAPGLLVRLDGYRRLLREEWAGAREALLASCDVPGAPGSCQELCLLAVALHGDGAREEARRIAGRGRFGALRVCRCPDPHCLEGKWLDRVVGAPSLP